LGCAVGAYLGLAPVFAGLQSGALSGQEAGLIFSFVGMPIGITVATASILASKKQAI
jgi:phosphoribosylcarboxyaminoimidazole (NCAIR) mutase